MVPVTAATDLVPTLRDFASEFMASHAMTQNKPSTVEAKRVILERHLLPRLGDLPLDRIGVREVSRLQAALLAPKPDGAGLSKKTTNNVCSVLRKLLAFAVDSHVIAHAPRIAHLKTERPEIQWFTPEECERLLAAVADESRPLLLVCLRTGIRVGELCALRWADVDLDARVMTVRRSRWKDQEGSPKGRRSRRVALSTELAETLKSYRMHAVSEYVFCRWDGSPHARTSIKWALWRACDRAGLPRCGFHRLGHSFASALVARGVNLRVIQRLLGHSTIAMTELYSHVAPADEQAAVEALDVPRDPTEPDK